MQQQATAAVSGAAVPQVAFPEGTLFVLSQRAGADKAIRLQRMGFVVRNHLAQFESYNVLDAEGNRTEYTIDKARSGDLYLKIVNKDYNKDKPRDIKTNNPYNIVSQLYRSQSESSGETYYRATVGFLPEGEFDIDARGKQVVKPGFTDKRTRLFMFKPDHKGKKATSAPSTLG